MRTLLSHLLFVLGLTSCSLFRASPEILSFRDRMAMIPTGPAPVQKPLNIFWDEHAVPYIEAEDDQDAAFALGLVHAHLRLGQLQVLRIMAQGRLSEVAGPIPQLKTFDHGIRILNFRKAAETSWQAAPEATRLWLQNFTRGLNWYIEQQTRPTFEQKLFDLPRETFTEQDVLTIGKLASSDLTWGIYLRFLKLSEDEGWEKALDLLLHHKGLDSVSFQGEQDPAMLKLLQEWTRSGSNSVVVSGDRSASGSALIANDPHVGIFLPNFWLLVGLRAPSYQVVGMMLPGLPLFGIGRNPDLAWGGTNMRAISSHLIDVSGLPSDQIQTRTEKIQRRWWFDTELTIRETPFGPILTDLDYFDRSRQKHVAALQWVGHAPSDEIGSFLAASRAKDGKSFHAAFRDYRVSAMNMLFAEKKGSVGMIPAYGQPVLNDPRHTLDLIKSRDNSIQGVLAPTSLPYTYGREIPIIASANNKPFLDPKIPLAFTFAPSDRHDRMLALLGPKAQIGLDDLKALQTDVYSESSYRIKSYLTRNRAQLAPQSQLWSDLLSWNGSYESQSRGAAAFEQLLSQAWLEYQKKHSASKTMSTFLSSFDAWKALLKPWFEELSPSALDASLKAWLASAEPFHQKYPTWGDLHRQTMQSPLGLIPVLGRKLRLPTYGESGSNDTLYKNGHVLRAEPSAVTYGASARHISDLADEDANYFVLKGGQDGWLNSPQLSDQLALWNEGRYITMPLRMRQVYGQFNQHVTRFIPGLVR